MLKIILHCEGIVRLSFFNEFHGSQRGLGSFSHSKTKHKFKKVDDKKLSKGGLGRCTKLGQANSNNERKITLSLIMHFIWDFLI